MSRSCVAVVASAAFFVGAAPSMAGKPEVWRHDSTKEFLTGERVRIVVGNDGRLQLARRIREQTSIESSHIWSIVPADRGACLAATGSPGRLLRIEADGKRSILLEDDKRQYFAAAIDGKGNAYAAASPRGSIRKVAPSGLVSTFATTNSIYVWALATDAAGNVHVATGAPARILKFDPAGKLVSSYEPKATHVLSLVVDANGVVYAGVSDRGLVYRIDATGKPFVLFDAPQGDVKSMCLDAKGNLYVGTASTVKSSGSAGGRGYESALELTSREAHGRPAPAGAAAAVTVGPQVSKPEPSVKKDAQETLPAFNGPAAAGENSVYRIAATGVVDEVFREKALILGLVVDGERLIVGTGHEGRLYEVDLKSNVACEWARLENGQLGALAISAGAVACGASNPGKLYRLQREFVERGEIVSAVRDAKLPARWGKPVVVVENAADADCIADFRCGNVAKPDETWSGWNRDPSTLPVARYCQYRIRLASATGACSPRVVSVQAPYATLNRPPTFDSLEVPILDKSPAVAAGGKIKIRWKASDPNGDTLGFNIAVRKEGWPDWVTVASELASTEFEWDTATTPAGDYRLRVVASDRASNGDAEARTAQKVSDLFVVDRAPPTVSLGSPKLVERSIVVQVTAADSQTRIASATYSVDGKAWVPLFADSGIFDATSTRMTVRTDRLDVGAHLLMVRVADTAGNMGVADAVVTVGESKPASAQGSAN